QWGYQEPSTYFLSWLLATLAIGSGWTIASRLFGRSDTGELVARAALIAFALVVLCGLLLGAIGRLSPTAYVVTELLFFLASRRIRPRDDRPTTDGDRAQLSMWCAGLVGALAVFAIAFAIGHAPLTLYDSVSYHLFFASRWLQDGRLSIIPTPFSDVA